MNDVWTIKRVLDWTTEFFINKNIPEARLSSEMLLGHVLQCKRMDLYVQFERILTPEELSTFRAFIQRRAKHEPVQYITGEQEFMGLKFKVSPDVLIPRLDTEILVERALSEFKQVDQKMCRVLDVGSGSGAITCSLAYHYPDWHFTGIDISQQAVRMAQMNARHLGLNNVRFHLQDGLQYSVPETEKYHFVISNPPYVAEQIKDELATQVLNYEPASALFAGKNGLDFYNRFIPRLPQLVTNSGIALFEIGYDQGIYVSQLLSREGFLNIQIIKDYQKLDRVIRANI